MVLKGDIWERWDNSKSAYYWDPWASKIEHNLNVGPQYLTSLTTKHVDTCLINFCLIWGLTFLMFRLFYNMFITHSPDITKANGPKLISNLTNYQRNNMGEPYSNPSRPSKPSITPSPMDLTIAPLLLDIHLLMPLGGWASMIWRTNVSIKCLIPLVATSAAWPTPNSLTSTHSETAPSWILSYQSITRRKHTRMMVVTAVVSSTAMTVAAWKRTVVTAAVVAVQHVVPHIMAMTARLSEFIRSLS